MTRREIREREAAEALRAEAGRAEVPRVEPAPVEPPRVEPPRVEPARVEAPRAEPPRADLIGAGAARAEAAPQPAPQRPGFDAIFGISETTSHPAPATTSHPGPDAPALRRRVAAEPAPDAPALRRRVAAEPAPDAPALRRRVPAVQTPFAPFTEAEQPDRPVGRSSASSVSERRGSENAFDALFGDLDDASPEPTDEPAGRSRRTERGGRPSRADRKAEKSQKAGKAAKSAKAAKAAKSAKSGVAATSAPAGSRRGGQGVPVASVPIGDDFAFLIGTSAASGAATSGTAPVADTAAGFATAIAAAAGVPSTPAPSAPPVPAPLTFDAPVRRDAAFDLFGLSATDAAPSAAVTGPARRAASDPTMPMVPRATELTVPSATGPVMPAAAALAVPSASELPMPGASEFTEPRAAAPTVPRASEFTAPTRRREAGRTPRDSRDDRRMQESARGAAGSRSRVPQPRAQASLRPASRPAASAPLRRRNAAGRIVSVVAMSFVALLAVATTIPSLSLLSAADVQALALSSTGGAGLDGQRMELNGDIVAQSVKREGYESQTIEEYAQAAGIRPEATFTNNPAGTIQWPFAVGVHIGDRFGYRSCAGCSSNHGGQDFNPGLGAEIQAIADGTVVESTDSGGSLGVVIMIDHMIDGELVTSVYAHMEYDSRRFAVGETVAVGDVIGTTGDTGMSTGPHLHFEIRLGGVDGTKVDPLEWLYANTN